MPIVVPQYRDSGSVSEPGSAAEVEHARTCVEARLAGELGDEALGVRRAAVDVVRDCRGEAVGIVGRNECHAGEPSSTKLRR